MSLFKWFVERDKVLNKALGGNKGETISSRLGRKIEESNCWPCRFICRTILLPLGWKHCRDVIQDEHRKK